MPCEDILRLAARGTLVIGPLNFSFTNLNDRQVLQPDRFGYSV